MSVDAAEPNPLVDFELIPYKLSRQCEPLRRLLGEVQDLKRIRSAAFSDTLATHRYRQVMQRLGRVLDRSHDPARLAEVAVDETVYAVVATRLGALGPDVLQRLGVPPEQIREICSSAFAEHWAAWPGPMPKKAFDGMGQRSDLSVDETVDEKLGMLIQRLCAEPRAGATAPHKSRVLVVPQESQAEHCYTTAVTAVILAAYFAADPGQAFAVALLHHLHNAFMPDAGFAGEILLGSSLDAVINAARAQALEYLPPALGQLSMAAAATMTHLETPVARVVNAADAIDRVLQTRFHQQMADFDAEGVQRDLDLVHEGPLQSFQNSVLHTLGL